MNRWQTFIPSHSSSHNDHCALKVCGVTRRDDALMLVAEKVHAIGINFWPLSKRFISHDDAAPWLEEISDAILRVGVFVNAQRSYIEEIVSANLIDVVQLHGDEHPDDIRHFQAHGIPVIKAWGMTGSAEDDQRAADFAAADAWLLDTPAPGQYGGTGAAFDWTLASQWRARYPQKPIILAGGITPENAAQAVRLVHPAALDVASGSEISPGIKDPQKVRALMAATQS